MTMNPTQALNPTMGLLGWRSQVPGGTAPGQFKEPPGPFPLNQAGALTAGMAGTGTVWGDPSPLSYLGMRTADGTNTPYFMSAGLPNSVLDGIDFNAMFGQGSGSAGAP